MFTLRATAVLALTALGLPAASQAGASLAANQAQDYEPPRSRRGAPQLPVEPVVNEDPSELEPGLIGAARRGDLETVRSALAEEGVIHRTDSQARTLLHIAAAAGREKVVALLLERGADPTRQDLLGYTAAHLAAGAGLLAIVERLVDLETQIDLRDGRGRTLLLAATEGGQLEPIERLLSLGADPNLADADGTTPVHYASASHNTPALAAMIPRVALGALDSQGNTALHLVAGFEEADLVRALVKRGAKVNARDQRGRTPLHVAYEWRSAAAARELIRAGADPDLRDRLGRQAVPRDRYALLSKPMLFRLSHRHDAETREMAAGSLVRLVEGPGRDSRPERSLILISGDWCGAHNAGELVVEDLDLLSPERLESEARKELDGRTLLGTVHRGNVVLFAGLGEDNSIAWCDARGQLFVDTSCGANRPATVYAANQSVSQGRFGDVFGDACSELGAGGLVVEGVPPVESAIVTSRPLPESAKAKTPDYQRELGNEAVSLQVLHEIDLDGDGVNELILRYLVDEEGYRRAIYQHDGERWVRRIPRSRF